MKRLAVVLGFVLSLSTAFAQVTFNGTYTATPVNNGTGAVVSIPIGTSGLSVSVGTGSAALPMDNIAGASGAQHLSLGDDSSASVPLDFSFPFWGQTFNNSWMYSNGIVSFTTGGIPGAGCCSGQDLSTLRDPNYNYAIMPLWTDLIDTSGQSTWVLKNSTSATYGWYGTKEYGTNNTNSFEVNINASGAMSVRYGGAFVGLGHSVTAGMTGNLANGEYFQYYNGQGFSVPSTNPVSWGWSGLYDLCLVDPLSSPSCAGYAAVYLIQQCAVNALYDQACPGYNQAYYFQRCTVDPLYDSGCPGYDAAYLTQQCSLNPLYSTSCDGYQQAYHDQQCSVDPLYATDCPGYAAAYLQQQCAADSLHSTTCPGYARAYHDQQCSLNALYATDCPGYQIAFYYQQCSLNALYDRGCPGYAEAYALKYIVVTAPTAAAVVSEPVTSSTTATAVVADPVVNQTVTTTATSAIPTAVTSVPLVPTPAPTAAAAAPTTTTATTQPMAAVETKSDAKPTARQEIQAKREAAAKAKAVEDGKNLANKMGDAANMEQQKQLQNIVIQAMGFTPGFDAYGKVLVPDSNGYKPFTVYKGQVNVDNKRLGWGLYGPSDRLHNDLVDLQYK